MFARTINCNQCFRSFTNAKDDRHAPVSDIGRCHACKNFRYSTSSCQIYKMLSNNS